MATSSGLGSQLGFKAESTYGTLVVVDRFAEYISDGLKLHIERIESKGAKAGRLFNHRRLEGKRWVDGPLKMELGPQGIGLLLKHIFGAVVTTGSNPYTHTYTNTFALDALSLSVQIAKPDTGGTTRVFDYTGIQFADWVIESTDLGKPLTLEVSCFGANEVTGGSLASASYPSGFTPFVFHHGALTLAAGAVDIKSIRLQGSNGFETGRHRISGTNPKQPKISKQASRRGYGGTIVADFADLTMYNYFVNATDVALVMAWTNGSTSLTITANVMFDGETPDVTDPEQLLEVTLPFTCYSGTSDTAAFQAVLVNADSTA